MSVAGLDNAIGLAEGLCFVYTVSVPKLTAGNMYFPQ